MADTRLQYTTQELREWADNLNQTSESNTDAYAGLTAQQVLDMMIESRGEDERFPTLADAQAMLCSLVGT